MTSPPKPMAWFQNNFTERFLRWPSIKIAKMVTLHWTKWPPELKVEKHLLLGQWPDFKIISQKCSLGDPLPKLLKWFRSAEQSCTKAKKNHLRPRPVARFINNFTEMFLGQPSIKIAKMVPLHWTKCPPKLKIDKTFKRHLLGQWLDLKIISQKCSLGDPPTKIA